MEFKLDEMSRSDLQHLQAEVEKALKKAEKRDRREALRAAEKAAAEFGYPLDELLGAAPAGATGGKLPPKYRNPGNPDQTWSGRGRRPRWLVEAQQQGRPLSEFKI